MDFAYKLEPILNYMSQRSQAGGLVVWSDTIAQSHPRRPDDPDSIDGGMYEGSAAHLAQLNTTRRDGKAAAGQVCGAISADSESDRQRARAFVARFRRGDATEADEQGFGNGGNDGRVGPRYKSLLARALMNTTLPSIPLYDITRARGHLHPGSADCTHIAYTPFVYELVIAALQHSVSAWWD